MKRIVLSLIAVSGLVGLAWAQGESLDCEQCYCVADNTPGATTGCAAGNDCEYVSFVAECTQQYTLRYSLSCNGESTCNDCFACVYLKDGSGQVIGTAHSACINNDCTGEGDQVTLTADAQYSLWVCLRYCHSPSTSDCNDCVARGYVYHSWSDCDQIVACNP